MKLRTLIVMFLLGQLIYSLCAGIPFFDFGRWVFVFWVMLGFWAFTQCPVRRL